QQLAHEPLATLGDALVLCRLVFSFSELAAADLPIGAVDKDAFVLIEADTPAQHSRVEEFAANRLGDAVVRLYERHAELLPDGPERDRATAAARAAEAFVGPLDIDHSTAVFAPNMEFHDYRSMGLGSLSGKEAMLDALRALLEMAAD